MLNFLRNNQRIFFIVVAVITISSFLFVGIGGPAERSAKAQDKKIGVAIDGSSIMEQKILAMSRLFSFCTPSMIEEEFLASGIGALIAEKNYEAMKDDLHIRLDRAKKYKPYVYPGAPFLSASAVWRQFAPDLNRSLETLRGSQLNPKVFSLLSSLYLEQKAFSPELLRDILLRNQASVQGLKIDPSMTLERLSLFGFASLPDWFGSNFMNAVSEFILNTSILAQEKGYKVSSREALSALLKAASTSFKGRLESQELSSKELDMLFYNQLQAVQISESEAVKIWKNVLLAKRLLESEADEIAIDTLAYENFSEYADASACIDLYELPENLRFKNIESVLKFQIYLQAATYDSSLFFKEIPQMKPLEEMEKKEPNFVYEPYQLEIAKIRRQEVALQIPLKKMWDWQIGDDGWKLLSHEFTTLSSYEQASPDERCKVLEKSSDDLREKIDQFTRLELLKLYPEWLTDALLQSPKQTLEAKICLKGTLFPFEDIDDAKHLSDVLKSSRVGSIISVSSKNQKYIYQIKVIKKPERKVVMTYQEALESGLLAKLLDKKLEIKYPQVRKSEPAAFQETSGSWQPFSQVKEQIMAHLYAEALRERSPQESLPPNVANVLFPYVANARESLKQDETSRFITLTKDPLHDQWIFIKSKQDISRSDGFFHASQDVFSSKEGEWSLPLLNSKEQLCFFKFISKKTEQPSLKTQVDKARQLLVAESRRRYAGELIDLFQEKK